MGADIRGSIASSTWDERFRTLHAAMGRKTALSWDFEVLELPFDLPAEGEVACVMTRSPLGTFPCCPLCGDELRPEHAHFRCACGWRDSCCD
jgi:hypothetical protein